ncbi:MAG: MBL fold metallo-hydrolase [Planctomycetaceae bacterium]|nr:MBL fold metallo-hydrolase [Planctomycetales bacterium]MCB9923645.1 MBL fold metallo-hydrolase [Planctomycetaceae bacterium]
MASKRLHLAVVVSQLFQENAYIAHLEGRSDCIVVDPGLDSRQIVQKLGEMGLEPAAILNTHGHADHIAGNAALKEAWPEAPLVIGTKDAVKLTNPIENLSRSYGIDLISPTADELVNEGDTFSAAGIELQVHETPGHSVGHVVFVWKGAAPWVVFGGDVLFQGSVGRTDFPDGSFDQLASSIRGKLYTLPDDTLVLPGHGPTTTIGSERNHNPFVPDR